jgi:signal transduction histidine kinase
VYLAFKSALRSEQDRAAAERAAAQAEALAAEQERLARAEHELVEKLQESDRLKDDLLATVSHELRTPLAGLLGALATVRLIAAFVAVTAGAARPLPPIVAVSAWPAIAAVVCGLLVAAAAAATILSGSALREVAGRRLRA